MALNLNEPNVSKIQKKKEGRIERIESGRTGRAFKQLEDNPSRQRHPLWWQRADGPSTRLEVGGGPTSADELSRSSDS